MQNPECFVVLSFTLTLLYIPLQLHCLLAVAADYV